MAFTKINKNSLSDPKTMAIWNTNFPNAKEFFPAQESLYKFFYLNHPGFPASDDIEVSIEFHFNEETTGGYVTWKITT